MSTLRLREGRPSSSLVMKPSQKKSFEPSFATVGEKVTPLRTAEDIARFARTVEATRTAKSHLLNDRSSRSHCLVTLHISRRASSTSSASNSNSNSTLNSNARKCAALFVDLAGSERIARTGAEGDAAAEARSINGSLSALGRVVKALSGRSGGSGGRVGAHVPYRDSTLTMLLRDSFGGKSFASVVINVAGEVQHAEETVCSLRFGINSATKTPHTCSNRSILVHSLACAPTQNTSTYPPVDHPMYIFVHVCYRIIRYLVTRRTRRRKIQYIYIYI